MTTNNIGLMLRQTSANKFHDSFLSAPSSVYRNCLKAQDIMSKNIFTVDAQSTVASAAVIMSADKISCLIVSSDGHFSGVVTETDMLKKAVADGNDFRTMKVEQIMSSPIRSIPHSLSVIETSRIMEDENIRRLVVQEEGEPVGIITQTDMVQVLASYTVSKEVSEIMTNDPVGIASSATAQEAAELMASQEISCLVVMDDDIIVGIFTERDLLKRVVALNIDPAKILLKQVMSEPVVAIPSNYSLLSATKLLESKGIRRLVVTESDTLLGVITQTDIHRALKASLQDEEQRYVRLLSESYNCIFTVDLDLNTTYINNAFMRLLNVTDPSELIDKPFLPERFWTVPEHRNQLIDRLRKVGLTVDELSLKTAKGNRISVILFCMPNKNLTGEVNGSQGILYNST